MQFQYISCYSLSNGAIFLQEVSFSFNTSHVTLYRVGGTGTSTGFSCVSIHLMLLFILQIQPEFLLLLVSIHLMLLFITFAKGTVDVNKMFQYISCYSLSLSFMHAKSGQSWFQYISCYSLSRGQNFTGEIEKSFNTSHVTLYHFAVAMQYQCFSRFNTSHVTLYQKENAEKMCNELGFNTSHVTLYPPPLGLTPSRKYCFNTSHVTLYPC